MNFYKPDKLLGELGYKIGKDVAEKIDEYAMEVWKVPEYVKKRLWLSKIYAKIYRFEIKYRYHDGLLRWVEFWAKGGKVGELNIHGVI